MTSINNLIIAILIPIIIGLGVTIYAQQKANDSQVAKLLIVAKSKSSEIELLRTRLLIESDRCTSIDFEKNIITKWEDMRDEEDNGSDDNLSNWFF